MSREDLPLLTAYALGELHGAEKKRIEEMIRIDPGLQKTIKEIRETAGMLAADLRPVQEPGLSSAEKLTVEQRWKELADKDSSSFFKRMFGPIPVMVSAAAAILIALAVSLPHFEKEQRRTPISETSAPASDTAMRAKESKPADEESPPRKADRNAHFLKIEKKEVNPEVAPAQAPKGAFGKDSRASAEGERVAAVGESAASGATFEQLPADKAGSKMLAPESNLKQNAPAKSKRQRALSVLFGGDGERVTGAPDTQSVKESLRTKIQEFTSCYQSTLENQPGTKGKVILKWKIKSGRAANIANASSTLGNASLENCIIETLKKAHFGPEMNGAIVIMPFHFAFQD